MNTEIRGILTDAVRYWEVRRIVYNAFLGIVCLVMHFSLPEIDRQEITPETLAGLLILAVVANLLYCAAYLPEIVAQLTSYKEIWKKIRIGLFIFGTLFAGVLASLSIVPLQS